MISSPFSYLSTCLILLSHEITVTDVTNEKEDQSEIIVTDNIEQINSQQESIKEEIISELESEDPWMKNKKSEATENTEVNDSS